jgi:hypothetical protein
MERKAFLASSNNPSNPNQNLCALKVANTFFVAERVRYLHTWGDLQRAFRKLWSFRSVRSMYRGETVAMVGNSIKAKGCPKKCVGFIVRVHGHVLALDKDGASFVDTDPVDGIDTRKVLDIYGVYLPTSNREKLVELEDVIQQVKRSKR